MLDLDGLRLAVHAQPDGGAALLGRHLRERRGARGLQADEAAAHRGSRGGAGPAPTRNPRRDSPRLVFSPDGLPAMLPPLRPPHTRPARLRRGPRQRSKLRGRILRSGTVVNRTEGGPEESRGEGGRRGWRRLAGTRT